MVFRRTGFLTSVYVLFVFDHSIKNANAIFPKRGISSIGIILHSVLRMRPAWRVTPSCRAGMIASFNPNGILVALSTAYGASSIQAFDNLRAFVDSKHAAIECNVIILSVAPFHIGVKTIICGTALVFIL